MLGEKKCGLVNDPEAGMAVGTLFLQSEFRSGPVYVNIMLCARTYGQGFVGESAVAASNLSMARYRT